MREANLIILVVLFGAITWTLGRNVDSRSHNAKTDWKDPCNDGGQETSGSVKIKENTSCKVTDIKEKWFPKLNKAFKEIAGSLTHALNAFKSAHGGSGTLHGEIEELKDPTSNEAFDKLNKETEKIIYRNYKRLTRLAAYLNVVNISEWIYGTDLSNAIKGIRIALCNMKMLTKSLALDEKNIILESWNFSDRFQTESNTELMNLNETVLTQGKEILDNLIANFVDNVNSSLSNCELKCHKKRKLVCKTNGQKKEKGKGKGKKYMSKKQRKNRKGKGKNRSS